MLTTFYHFLPHLNNIIDFIKSQANLKKFFVKCKINFMQAKDKENLLKEIGMVGSLL